MRELTTQELDLVAGGFYLGSDLTGIGVLVGVASAGVAIGHVATAEADAYGRGTLASTQTLTTPRYSGSTSLSVTGGR